MDRFHKHSVFSGLSMGRAISLLALMGFALFVSFRIFTPPTKIVEVVTAPDGTREARLLYVFYYSEPGYKISTRTGRLWHTLFYLPDYPEVALKDRVEELKWSHDSKRLSFEINGKLIWQYNVSNP